MTTSSDSGDVCAFVAHDDSLETYLLGPGKSTAYRDRDGIWSSPAPSIDAESLAASFERLDESESDQLNVEALICLCGIYAQRPRLMPWQLIAIAKGEPWDISAGQAMMLAQEVIQRAADPARSAWQP